MSHELTASLVARVNEAHSQFMAAGNRASDSLLDQVNAARETGLFLLQLKEQTKHGDWLGLFKTAEGSPNPTPALDFDANTGRTYMKVAERLKEPVTSLPDAMRSLKDVMIAVGALPEPCRLPQRASGLGPFSVAEKYIDRFWAVIGKEKEKVEVGQWPAEQRAHLKGQLKPMVELYEQL